MKKLLLISLVSMFTFSCEGNIRFDAQSPDSIFKTPDGNDKTPDDKDPEIDPEIDAQCVGCTALKRLTQTEYQNSVELILGVVPNTRYDNLPSDGKTGAFRTNILNVDVDSVESYRSVAEEISSRFVELDSATIGCDITDENCARELLDRVGPLFYRRPLETEEKDAYVNMLTILKDAGESSTDRVRLLISAFLQSPRFIYKVEKGEESERADILKLNGYEIASRLSYFLWKSGPDKTLIDAAEQGDLDTKEGVIKEAERMLEDARAMVGIVQFHREWLGFDDLKNRNIDDNEYMALRLDMVKESEDFIREIFLGNEPTLHSLFTAKFSNPSPELAAFYGVTPDAAGRIIRDDGHHSGILTQASFLAAHSSEEKSTAVYRGLVVMENINCIPRRAPGPITEVIAEDPADSLRDQLTTITSPAGCQGCHKVINNIGFGFGHYDRVGRYREMDNGHEVDDSGEVFIWNESVTFKGTAELAELLSEREEVHMCLTKSWFEYAMGRRYEKADEVSLSAVNQAYNTSGKNIRELMLAIVKTPSFQHRRLPVDE